MIKVFLFPDRLESSSSEERYLTEAAVALLPSPLPNGSGNNNGSGSGKEWEKFQLKGWANALTQLREAIQWEYGAIQLVKEIEDADLAIYPEKVVNPSTLQRHPHVVRDLNNAVEDYRDSGKKGLLPPLLIDAASDYEGPLCPGLLLATGEFSRCIIMRTGLINWKRGNWKNKRWTRGTLEIERPTWCEGDAPNLEAIVGSGFDESKLGNEIHISFDGTYEQDTTDRWGYKIGRRLPKFLAMWVLTHEHRKIGMSKGCAHALRAAACATLKNTERVHLHTKASDFGETHSRHLIHYYARSGDDQAKEKEKTQKLLAKSPYTLCVRGSGNFSYRLDYALRAGRIPVLIDTDGDVAPPPPKCEEPKILTINGFETGKIGKILRAYHAGHAKDLASLGRKNALAARHGYAFAPFCSSVINRLLQKEE